MASKVDRSCKACGTRFTARTTDVKRGWALFCSKRCKAIDQGRQAAPRRVSADGFDEDSWDTSHPFSGFALGQD